MFGLGAGQLFLQCSASDSPHPFPLLGRRGHDNVPARTQTTDNTDDTVQPVAAVFSAPGPPQKSNFACNKGTRGTVRLLQQGHVQVNAGLCPLTEGRGRHRETTRVRHASGGLAPGLHHPEAQICREPEDGEAEAAS